MSSVAPRPVAAPADLKSIFTPATGRERAANFESYWAFTRGRDGEILEADKDLTRKREILAGFHATPVRSKKPLPDPERFYRNYVELKDDPRTFDRKTLLLTFLYKFARHEWAGISCAWDATPSITLATRTTHRISRYHLCEEFSHVRLFHEMFRTFHLDRVEWVPPGNGMRRMYAVFSRFPGVLMNPPAFVSELMGLTLYLHIDAVLDDFLGDEPEARDRVRALLREIMTDEMAHVGQRRNFIGPVGIHAARAMVGPMFRGFYRDLPEAKLLFDIDRMVEEAKAFRYTTMPPEVIAKSWVPSYCRG
ncbi:MAG: hypothetical protein WAU32_14435 [Thermoanaerobaculia bacterium]|jgi:hypothetical protein